ncbi:unnamed protein product [Brassica rapa subsp. narinosa]
MLTYNIDANLSVDAKNQNMPSETKPPMVHNLSHHFSSVKVCLLMIVVLFLHQTLNGCKCSRWQSRSL